MEPSTPPKGPQSPADRLPPGAPDGLRDAADGEKPPGLEDGASREEKAQAAEAEIGALDYLLGGPAPLEYDVEIRMETDAGDREMTFHIQQMDGDRIAEIEKENTPGGGPFAEMDSVGNDVQLVQEATLYLKDATGRKVEIDSPEFRGVIPDPKLALRRRFARQLGLLTAVANRVRTVSGYSGDRVGMPERATVEAASNSSSGGE